MKKSELKIGDIVECRAGQVGVIIRSENADYILYTSGGFDDLDDYSEDMLYLYHDGETDVGDIMRVYRESWIIGFSDYNDDEPIYERDENWIKPEQTTAHGQGNAIEAEPETGELNTDNIIIMAQAFYGNRTETTVNRNNIDRFILGHLDCTVDCDERIDRTIVQIPHTEHLVLIYNKYEEAKRLESKKQYFEEDGYVLKPLAVIPGLNLELYSRCIVCRMNDAGQLESLEDEDYSLFMDYLAE